MQIPQNITKAHLLSAISKIDEEGIPTYGASHYYDVIHNSKKYPPKLIVSYANIFANGQELDRAAFNGGADTPCFKLLEEHGFKIIKKSISYYLLGAIWDESNDLTKRFIDSGTWENGYNDKFIEIVKGVQIGDRVAIKSSFATRDGKSMLRVKATGVVYENIGDGKHLKIQWDKTFVPFDLEGYGTYRNTIQKVSDDHIDAIFKTQNKMAFYNELVKFIEQANTSELRTSQYLKSYSELIVKVSFGQGNLSRVPWIAFVKRPDNVQHGIYPVYLYYKSKNLLILAYGVSETHKSNRKWNITSEKKIEDYFLDNNLGKPERYGSSYIFNKYDTNKPLNETEINDDLNKLISIYRETFDDSILKEKTLFDYKAFQGKAIEAGYFANENLSTRFIASLLTKPFVILTGLSGSGKTRLAQTFAMWLCEDETQYNIVPVGADWTNREPLLGYPNPIEKNNYVKPENRVLDLIINANKNKEKPYFLILDEMNLSHVERYFSDFLSVMESDSKIFLHSGDNDKNGIPSTLELPDNFFIIGTVNIDETTYMFSPKVLDRASVIEFRITYEEMNEYLELHSKIKFNTLKGAGCNMSKDFIDIARDKNLSNIDLDSLKSTLMHFFIELKKTGAEFGYRSANEIIRFSSISKRLNTGWKSTEILDAAIMQKLLPKLHGSRRKLEPVLKTLGGLCLNDGFSFEDYLNKKDSKMAKFPMSIEKILRMYENLLSNGFTSYAEA